MNFDLINLNFAKTMAYLALVVVLTACADNNEIKPDPLPNDIQSLEKLLKDGLSGDTRLQAYYMLYGRYLHEDNDRAEQYIDELLKLAEEKNSTPYKARAIHGKGYVKHLKGDYLNALPSLLLAVDLFNELGDAARMADDINNIGLVFLTTEGYEDAIPYFEKATNEYSKTGDLQYQLMAYTNLAICHIKINDYPKAIDILETVLSLQTRIDATDNGRLAYYHNELARVYYFANDYIKSIRHYEKALELSKDTESNYVSHYGIGNVYIAMGNAQKAKHWLDQAPATTKDFKEGDIIKGLNVYGALYQLQGNHQKAAEVFEKAISLANKDIINEPLSETLDLLSQSYRALTDNGAKVAYDDIYRIADLKKQQQELKDSFYDGMNAKALQAALNQEVEAHNNRKLQASMEAQQWVIFRYGSAIVAGLLVLLWVTTRQKRKWALASQSWEAKSHELANTNQQLIANNKKLESENKDIMQDHEKLREISRQILAVDTSRGRTTAQHDNDEDKG